MYGRKFLVIRRITSDNYTAVGRHIYYRMKETNDNYATVQNSSRIKKSEKFRKYNRLVGLENDLR